MGGVPPLSKEDAAWLRETVDANPCRNENCGHGKAYHYDVLNQAGVPVKRCNAVVVGMFVRSFCACTGYQPFYQSVG